MGTPFSNIYHLFLSQIKDYELKDLAMKDEAALEANLQLWLLDAITFFHSSKKDLSKLDKLLDEFDEELTSNEQTILAKYMTYSYIKTYLMREENLSQALNSKDYRMYSPANQLKALQNLCEFIKNETMGLQSQYSWSPSSVREMYKK